MGYFANGTEAEGYQAQWCARCKHDEEDPGCMIWLAHLLWAYSGTDEQKEVLDLLIPPTKSGFGNEQCKLFVARADA